ncbi:MAG: phosphatase PAP2 family protein [Cytophagales bacterium]|nr:phosphatase PAP2 family protein [Cytophagales bacterium]
MQKYFYLFLLLFPGCLKAQKSYLESSGDIFSIALPAVAFLSSINAKSEHSHVKDFALGFLCSELTTHSLKRIIDKPRPNGGRFSFPSGHTSAAFFGASFVHQRFGYKVGIPTYLLATYVGYTRIKANKHDIYDVLGGAVIGLSSCILFRKSFRNQNHKTKVDITLLSFNLQYTF